MVRLFEPEIFEPQQPLISMFSGPSPSFLAVKVYVAALPFQIAGFSIESFAQDHRGWG